MRREAGMEGEVGPVDEHVADLARRVREVEGRGRDGGRGRGGGDGGGGGGARAVEETEEKMEEVEKI